MPFKSRFNEASGPVSLPHCSRQASHHVVIIKAASVGYIGRLYSLHPLTNLKLVIRSH